MSDEKPSEAKQRQLTTRSHPAEAPASEEIAPAKPDADAGHGASSPNPLLPAFTPVPREKDRSNGWKPEVQRAFIEALADTGSVKAACRRVGRTEYGVYQLRRHPEASEFRAAWEAALQLGIARIEDIAMERAIHGTEEPVYSYGKLIGTRRRHNDRLLMFLLRNRAPDRFTEGRAKAMNAMDLTRLEQEKKKWRREWELEQQAARPKVSPQEIRASIDRKVEALRLQVEAQKQREWDALSDETKAAWERFEALKERDLVALKQRSGSAEKDSQCLLESGDRGATSDPQGRPAVAPNGAEPSDADASRPALEGENQTIRTIKDEGWDN